MQDLFQNYVDDLIRLRETFHSELSSTSEELTKALAHYAARGEAALASFMEKAAARGEELEAAAAVRYNQFRGLPPSAGVSDVDNALVPRTPTNPDKVRIETAAAQAFAENLPVQSEGDKSPPVRTIALVKSEPPQSESAA
jgi:hypothetical protein